MKRKVFFSFHYQKDNWRVQQVRNMGVIEGNAITTPNDWETIARKGDQAIKNWIDQNLIGCSCLVVLIGEETSNRKYVLYEIESAWNRGMGVLGIYIDGLKDLEGKTSRKGNNPFTKFKFQNPLLNFNVPILDPDNYSFLRKIASQETYKRIEDNLGIYIEKAISYRKNKPNISKR